MGQCYRDGHCCDSGFFLRCSGSVLFDFFPDKNFRGVLARIQDGHDISNVAIDPVIYPIWKTRGEEPVMITSHRMNAAKRCDGINIGPDRIQKIPAQPLLLVFVKNHASFEVPLCGGKDRDFHA